MYMYYGLPEELPSASTISLFGFSFTLSRGLGPPVGRLPILASTKSISEARSSVISHLALTARTFGLSSGRSSFSSLALSMAARLYDTARAFASPAGKVPLSASGRSSGTWRSAFTLIASLSARSLGLVRASSSFSSLAAALSGRLYDTARAFASAPPGKLALSALVQSISPMRASPAGKVGIAALSAARSALRGAIAGVTALAARASSLSEARSATTYSLALSGRSVSMSVERIATTVKLALNGLMESGTRARTSFIGSVRILGSSAIMAMQRGTMSATAAITALFATGRSQVKAISNLAVVANLLAMFATGVSQTKGRAQAAGSLPIAARTSLFSHSTAGLLGAVNIAARSAFDATSRAILKAAAPLLARGVSQLKATPLIASGFFLTARAAIASSGVVSVTGKVGLAGSGYIKSASFGAIKIIGGLTTALIAASSIRVYAALGNKFFESIFGRPVESSGPDGGPELPNFPD